MVATSVCIISNLKRTSPQTNTSQVYPPAQTSIPSIPMQEIGEKRILFRFVDNHPVAAATGETPEDAAREACRRWLAAQPSST